MFCRHTEPFGLYGAVDKGAELLIYVVPALKKTGRQIHERQRARARWRSVG